MFWKSTLCRSWCKLTIVLVALLLTGAEEPSYEGLCDQARQCLKEKRYDAAVDAYLLAATKAPEEPMAHFGLATTYRELENHQGVIDSATAAIGTQTELALAYTLRAQAFFATDHLDKAVADYTAAIAADSESAAAHYGLAKALHKQKKYEEAATTFSKTIQLDGSLLEAYIGRARVYCDQKRYEDAIDDYDYLIRRDKECAPYYLWRAQVHYDLQDYPKVHADCQIAIQKDPALVAAYGLRGAAHLASEAYDLALRDFSETVSRAKDDPTAFLWRGEVHLAQGNVDAAIKDYSRAIDIDPSHIRSYEARLAAYEKAGEHDLAQADYKKMEELEAARRAPAEQTVGGPPLPGTRPSAHIAGLSLRNVTRWLDETEKRPSASSQMSDLARTEALARRSMTEKTQAVVNDCDMTSLTPETCHQADRYFKQATIALAAEEFEMAAFGFRKAGEYYTEAIAHFEKAAGSNSSLWLDWAEKKNSREVESQRRTLVWMTLAEVHFSVGSEEGYRRCIDKAIGMVRTRGITDPGSGGGWMLQIAELQTRCGDDEGALASVADAARFCAGIQSSGTTSIGLARCAGYCGQLGNTTGWNRYVQQALDCAARTGDRFTSRRQVFLAKAAAYAEAYDAATAMGIVRDMESRETTSDRLGLARWPTGSYARITRCAALAISKGRKAQEDLEAAYVATCGNLATLRNPLDPIAQSSRHALARSNADVGAFARALVGAIDLPDPAARNLALALILRRAAEDKKYAWARIAERLLDMDSTEHDGIRWTTEIRVKQEPTSMVTLKRWTESHLLPVQAALAMGGIAAAVHRRDEWQVHTETTAPGGQSERSHKIDVQEVYPMPGEMVREVLEKYGHDRKVREEFERTAASHPQWWLGQAHALAKRVDEPLDRAALWRQLAAANWDFNDEKSAHAALDETLTAIVAAWKKMGSKRGKPYEGYNSVYRWNDNDTRTRRSRVEQVHEILTEILQIEALMFAHGDRQQALDTLLLALTCIEGTPRDAGVAPHKSLVAWMPRLVGRLRAHRREDLAQLLLADLPWSNDNLKWGGERYVYGLVAAESGDLATLGRYASEMRSEALRTKSSDWTNYAAILHGHVAKLAVRKGDESLYQSAAVVVGGLVNAGRVSASSKHLALLAEAAIIHRDWDAAEHFLTESDIKGTQRDRILAQVFTGRLEAGEMVEARVTLAQIDTPRLRIPIRYALMKTEASAPSARLSTIYEAIQSQPSAAERSASLAGVAVVLLTQ